jgi:hypothetical protein
MRILWNILAVLLIIIGGVWFLQGINILPGSFMTGQSEWVVFGAIVIVLGLGLLAYANLKAKSLPKR